MHARPVRSVPPNCPAPRSGRAPRPGSGPAGWCGGLLIVAGSWLASGPGGGAAELPAAPAPPLLGFTSWPYAATTNAIADTYRFIGRHGNLLVEHLDDGVPWAEALADKPWPVEFQRKLEGKRRLRPAGTRLLLSLTALDMGRKALAPCAGEGTRPPLPTALVHKPFDDPQLVRAYTTYCRRLIEFFQPDFVLTGIEANELLNNTPDAWEAYRRFSTLVQVALRREWPRLPMAESVTLHKLLDRQNPDLETYRRRVGDFVGRHDFMGVSFYPLFLGQHTRREFDESLAFLRGFARKPIAITETGHPAEPVNIQAWKFQFASSPAEQADYARALLQHAREDRYLFVTWWVGRDFDALWQVFPESVKDLGAIWRDTGLLDEQGRPRPAFGVWTNQLGSWRAAGAAE